MAKKDKEQLPDIPETMEDYMLRQLKKTVILKTAVRCATRTTATS